MKRGFWFLAGAGAGVYAMTKARRVAEAFTVEGVRDRVSGAAAAARIFRDEMVAGQQEKESELRERLGLVPHGMPELTAAGGQPAGPRRIDPTRRVDEIDPTHTFEQEGTS
ncbi:MAG: hypothetical protein KDB63_03305 [Nocardioidaceae bacterium]|nr:hypothetical protein [Nocardioidaceae bacterium]